jgi:hypothetical protein
MSVIRESAHDFPPGTKAHYASALFFAGKCRKNPVSDSVFPYLQITTAYANDEVITIGIAGHIVYRASAFVPYNDLNKSSQFPQPKFSLSKILKQ